VPTFDMPGRPDLQHFRRQARTLQRAVRAGEPEALALVARHHPDRAPSGSPADTKLSTAQLVVARAYGFASWPRLVRFMETVAEHGRESGRHKEPTSDPAAEFCRLACLTYTMDDEPKRWRQAREILAEDPALTANHIWAAAAAGRPDDVGRLLAGRRGLATERGGPYGWSPLYYLVYSRVESAAPADEVARLLLDAGADPDEGYLIDALPSPFTLLTGVFGNGELGGVNQPRHPRWLPLGRMLLDAGADPNDAQALYNRMFEADDSHLELLFEYGLGTGDGGPWKERIPDLATPVRMLRVLLRWAVEHHQPARVRLLAEHGVDVVSPFEGDGPPWSPGDGRTPVEVAELCGDTEIAEYLAANGAAPPGSDPVRELIAAAFRADLSTVERIGTEHPGAAAEARASRPGLMVWAAAKASVETVSLLAGLGFDVNAYGRGDAPVEQEWETALHQSAGNGDVALTVRLLKLGADPDLRDRRFGATPLDWVRHLGRPETAAVLEPLTAQ
jgi:hypothetical protein